jgi:hypothetical protein
MAAPRILFIQQDWPEWARARSWSYGAHLGLFDALREAGAACELWMGPWVGQAATQLYGKRFDQIWFNDLPHLEVDPAFFAWAAEAAPVRVGLLVESMTYTDEELAINPSLRGRPGLIRQRLGHVTHAVACDEADRETLHDPGHLHAMWSPFTVGQRAIREPVASPAPGTGGTFCGSLYGRRQAWMSDARLAGRLRRQPSSEAGTLLPRLFGFTGHFGAATARRSLTSARGLYNAAVHRLRRSAMRLWMKELARSPAVVNLPHMVKTYTPRVVEGMAAARPVVSWRIPSRPLNQRLFEENAEILLYSPDDPASLADCFDRLDKDPRLSGRLITAASARIRQFHTTEGRVRQILRWIETGTQPAYW